MPTPMLSPRSPGRSPTIRNRLPQRKRRRSRSCRAHCARRASPPGPTTWPACSTGPRTRRGPRMPSARRWSSIRRTPTHRSSCACWRCAGARAPPREAAFSRAFSGSANLDAPLSGWCSPSRLSPVETMPKHNLLVADADPRTLRILDVALRRAGFAVATAGDGGEALRRIQRALPDLVLSDTGLPTQDGFELCRTLRADDRFATIPILLMSSDRDPNIRVRAGEAGADDFFEKPILVKELVAPVRALISERLAAAPAAPVRPATPA